MMSLYKKRSHRYRPCEQGNCGNIMVVRAGESFLRSSDEHSINPGSSDSGGVCSDVKTVQQSPRDEGSSMPASRDSCAGNLERIQTAAIQRGNTHHVHTKSSTDKINFKFSSHLGLRKQLLHDRFCGCQRCSQHSSKSSVSLSKSTVLSYARSANRKYSGKRKHADPVSTSPRKMILLGQDSSSISDIDSIKHVHNSQYRKRKFFDGEQVVSGPARKSSRILSAKISNPEEDQLYNTLKFFGLHNIFNVWDFIRFCASLNISCHKNNIITLSRSGYKGKHFDSRTVIVSFSSHASARYVFVSLKSALNNIRIVCSYRDTDVHSKSRFVFSQNRFASLADNNDIFYPNVEGSEVLDKNDIRFSTWNIQSIVSKSSLLIDFMINNSIQLLAVTETRWKGDNFVLPYDFHWFGKKFNSKSGGVGFILHSSIVCNKHVRILPCRNKNRLYLLVSETANFRSTLFVCVYGPASPSNLQSTNWWTSLEDEFVKIRSTLADTTDIVILGDFNSRIGSPRCISENGILGKYGETKRDFAGKNAINFLHTQGMICLNNRRKNKNGTNFTYHQQGKISSKSIIDLVFISKGMFRDNYHTRILQTSLTGHESHFPVISDIRFKRKIIHPRPRFTVSNWNFQKFQQSKNDFIADRDVRLNDWMQHDGSVDLLTDKLTKIVHSSACAKIGKIRKTYKTKSGFVKTKQKKLLQHLRKRYRQMLKQATNLEHERCADKNYDELLKNLRIKIDSVKSVQKRSDFRRISRKIQTCVEKNDSKLLFGTAQNFIDPKVPVDINGLRDSTGNVHTKTEDMLEIMKSTWQEVFKAHVNSRKPKNHRYNKNFHQNDLCSSEISPAEVIASLKNQSPGKAQGLDSIPIEFLNDSSNILVTTLCRLFNTILKTGVFPKCWKIDRRTPIFKKGSKLDADNYRPIAVHSVFRKIFCEIIRLRVEKIVKIHDNQYGFIKNRRCSDHAAVVRDLIIKHFHSKKHGELFIALFDFSKAFDSCDIGLLLDKLYDNGIRGPLFQVIRSMYDGCQSKVYLHGKYSNPFSVCRGVAQGCKLSTLLFNIYINDLLLKLCPLHLNHNAPKCIALCYADDLIVAATSRESLQGAIAIIEKWCKANLISVNARKSKLLCINADKSKSVFKINGRTIPIVTELKYLGFLITETGSWERHITNSINIVNALSYKWKHILQNYSIPYFIRFRLADAIILSHLRYGEEIFALNTSLLQRLQAAENNVAKMILNLPRNASTCGILHLTGRLSTESRIRLQRLVNLCRINRSPLLNLHNILRDIAMQTSPKTLVHQFLDDQNFISQNKGIRSRVYHNIPEALISDETIDYRTCKSRLKCFVMMHNNTENYRSLLASNHRQIVQFNSRVCDSQLLYQSGKEFNSLFAWKLGIIPGLAHRKEFAFSDYNSIDVCPLCKLPNNHYLPQHLLTDCPATYPEMQRYFSAVKTISENSFNELTSLSPQDRWLWILRAGDFCEYKDYTAVHRISEGSSVSPGIDKQNICHRIDAIMEYEQIVKEIPENIFVVYTDGSKKESKCGAGAVIFYNSQVYKELSFSLQNCENNFAELYAIYKTIKYLRCNYQDELSRNIHLFTDSRFSIDALTLKITSHKYHKIISKIIDEVSVQGFPNLILHWVPSHIEISSNGGKRSIAGNDIADKIAGKAAQLSTDSSLNVRESFVEIPSMLLHAAAELTSAVDILASKASESSDSQNVGPSLDDCSSAAATQITSLRSSVTSPDVRLN